MRITVKHYISLQQHQTEDFYGTSCVLKSYKWKFLTFHKQIFYWHLSKTTISLVPKNKIESHVLNLSEYCMYGKQFLLTLT